MREERRIVIAMQDEERAYSLAFIFLKHGAMEKELEIVTDVSLLQRPETIDWLVAEEKMAEQIPAVKGMTFVTGGQRVGRYGQKIFLQSISSAETFYQNMIRLLMSHQADLKREEAEEDRRDNSEDTEPRLYITCSPVGGCGKTLGSLSLCRELAGQQKKVLYVNMEETQDFCCFLDEENCADEEFAFSLKDGILPEDEQIAANIQSGEFDYLKPLPGDYVMTELAVDVCEDVVRGILNQQMYDVVVVEIPCSMNEIFLRMMALSDKVIIFVMQDAVSSCKLKRFLQKLPVDREQCLFLCGKFEESKEDTLDDVQITEYIVRLEEASLQALQDNGCFCLTAEILR